jgi:DNA-binding Lrp family transcriptional regulator
MCSVQCGEYRFNMRHSDETTRHTMYPTLDETDRQLLSLLQANARESTATLARRLGLARTTVVSRIARLERDGVVAGYGVRLGTRMDQATVRAWCSLSVLPQSAPQVLRALAAMPEVEEVSAVSGPFDYLAFLRCPSHERLDALLDQIGQTDGVHRTQTSIVLSRKIDRRGVVV